MFNKTIPVLSIVSALFVSSTGFAQDPIHVSIAHDRPSNDPSDPKRVLKLKKEIPQKQLVVQGTLKQLARQSSNGAKIILNPFAGYDFIQSVLDPNFEQILKKEPTMLDYFYAHQDRRTPMKKNGPTTVNADHEYAGISDREFGYCWGYATLVRFFAHVAFYDAKIAKPKLQETIAQVDQVLKGQATLITGYRNLRELTLVPEIELHLKLAAMELWRARALKFSSLGITMKSTNWMKFEEVENLAKDLEKRLARGEFPKLIFSSLIPTHPFMGMNTDIHVVPVYKVERLKNHRMRFYLWDINFYAETLQKSPKYLEIDSNHQITYAPYKENDVPYAYGSDIIGRVIIAPENDDENAIMLNSLKRFCNTRGTAKYCASTW